MGYPHDLHCPTNIHRPEAVGICDRCGAKYYLDQLRFQWDWRGNALANLRLRVCPTCTDRPFEHNRPIIIGPDPVPPKDPRPPSYAAQMGSSTVLVADDGSPLTDDDGGRYLIPD